MENARFKPAVVQDSGTTRRGLSFDPQPMFPPIQKAGPSSQQPIAKTNDDISHNFSDIGGTTSDECVALTQRIHNDNFNIKFKAHMINKLLDEGSPASPQLLEDLKNMEAKAMKSQQRYERLERKTQLKKRRKRNQREYTSKEQHSLTDRKGKGVGAINSSILDGMSDLDRLSFSAVEREHDAVERKFQEALGQNIFDIHSPSKLQSLPAASSSHEPSSPPFFNNPSAYPKPPPPRAAKIAFDMPSPVSSVSSLGDDFKLTLNESPPKPRKVTRFASTTTSMDSNSPALEQQPPHTPIATRWNIPDIKSRKDTPAHLRPIISKLDDLSLSDTDSAEAPYRFQHPVSDKDKRFQLNEVSKLQKIIDRQAKQLSEQAVQIESLNLAIDDYEYDKQSLYHHPPPSNNPAPPSLNNGENTTHNTVYYDPVSTFAADTQTKPLLGHVIAGLTQVYDSARKVPGIPYETISVFQNCLLDLAAIAQDPSTVLPKPTVPLDDATAKQQLLLYRYDNIRQKLAVADLQFITSFQSKQIQTYQAANKTRTQFLRSLGLLPSRPNNMTTKYVRGKGYVTQDSRPRPKGAARLRSVVFYVMAARRFCMRLDTRNQEKRELKQQLIDLG